MENEIIFIGMDFVNEIHKLLKAKEHELCANMTEEQLGAYHYGIDTIMSLFRAIVDTADSNEVFVHIDGLECQQEFDLVDLVSKVIG